MWILPTGKREYLSDVELLAQYRKTGNIDWLGTLYMRYIHLVYAVALKYLNSKEDSNDAVMELFEKLVVETSKHEIINFPAWLHATSRNFCLMKLRRKKKPFSTVATDEIVDYLDFMHPMEEDLLETDLKLLEECLGQLAEAQKKCVSMFYLEEKSYRQVAVALGMEHKTVKSHIQNGKRNLKNCINRSHEEG